MGFNMVVDAATAEAMRRSVRRGRRGAALPPKTPWPSSHEKKNLRVVELPRPEDGPTLDFKRVRGGFLAQDRFRFGGVAEEAAGRW